jgi:hypothetical protein
LKSFIETAACIEWLRWAEDEGFFGPLVDAAMITSAEPRMLAYWFAERYAVAQPKESASHRAPGEVPHDRILMAIPDEQHGVLPKHLHKETCSPTVREVRLSEIPVGQHEVRARVFYGTVQVHHSSELSA